MNRKPLIILFLIALTAMVALTGFHDISTANRVDQIVEDKADLQIFENMISCFGNDQTLLLSVSKASSADGFSRADIMNFRALIMNLENLKGISRISSILDYLNFRRDDQSFEKYLSRKRVEKFNREINELTVPSKLLVSNSGNEAGIVITLENMDADQRKTTLAKIRKITESFTKTRFHLFGYPVFEARYFQLINSNNRKLLGASLIFCTLITYLLFRRISTVLIVMTAIILPPLYTFGLYFHCGNSINMLTSLIIPLCLIISLNTSIYILAFHARNSHLPFRGLSRTLKDVLKPCLLATLTTFIGFSSLCLTPSQDLRLFGAYSSLAALFSFLSVFLTIFSFLHLGLGDSHRKIKPVDPGTEKAESEITSSGNQLSRSLSRLITRTVLANSRLILISGTLLLLISIHPLLHGNLSCSLEDTFLDRDPVLQDAKAVDKSFSGGYSLSVVIENQFLIKPDVLRAVRNFQNHLLSTGKIRKALSIVNLIEDFCLKFSPEEDGLPAREGQISNILEFYESRDALSPHLSRFRDICRIRIWPGITDYFEILDLEKSILNDASAILPAGTKVDITGRIHISSMIQKKMTLKALSSLGFAMAAILIVMGILFRSLKMAVFALFANVTPLVLTYGIALSSGFPINVSTTIVGTVMMGLIVDDTIHFLHFYDKQKKMGRTTRKSIINTLGKLTRPITFTSIILLTGTLIFTLADFRPIINFGAISSIMIVFAWIFDIIFLPAMILCIDGSSERKS
ncbi:MAG: hypothetical protein CVV64_00150 [Candidatus Wallbacteria bacterium HGW-Wallbacteria-1]|jgi:hypothetical protein|uniref:SSD domain-containing protein n=1 Tax=Candidatus Wallbacteria bacterium HGW-Wallbacteria-1 TaxID=2013854 RepID=A0A2N1PU49_9BACT|nr:MAG: hypothetical protein CVV64_00150 [Candidatus Wallbacteria bacterium HGW-Wallbacteria-1]